MFGLALVLLLSTGVLAASEDEAAASKSAKKTLLEDLSLEAELAWNNKYIWRGLNLTDGDVLQPTFTVGYKGLSFNWWGNMELTSSQGKRGYFTEQDFTVDYSSSWKKLNFSVGAIWYKFTHTHFHDTVEVYGSLGVDVLLQPTITIYRDIDEADGSYTVGSISHSFELPKMGKVESSLDPEATLGGGSQLYGKAYYGVRRHAFTDMGLFASLPIRLNDHVTIRPQCSYTSILDGRMKNAADHDGNATVGIALVLSY